MKIARFNEGRLGVVEGDTVYDVTPALDLLPAVRYPLPRHDMLIADLDRVTAAITAMPRGAVHGIEDVTFLSPVANPGKLVAAPVNYEAHLQEALADKNTFAPAQVRRIQESGLFLKATSSLIGSGERIEIRHADRRTDHEIELAVVIGRSCRAASRADALSYVAGYAIGLDITVRGTGGTLAAQVARHLLGARPVASDGGRVRRLRRARAAADGGRRAAPACQHRQAHHGRARTD